MAVKATASITVSFERDIISVTWYYKLQASTASPPAKPTTATPSGWTTTEPTYTEGSTNSLYVCQKTTFSDGTFAYSDVSLSSAYEAAKAAYNKSVAALDAVTPIATKTYTGVTITANSDPAGWLYFGYIKPTDYYTPWRIKYRVNASITTLTDAFQYSEVLIDGAKNTYYAYQVYNSIPNASYRPLYAHLLYTLKQAGVTSGYGHLLGFRFQSAYWGSTFSATAWPRTIKIEIIEAENCTFEFANSMFLYSAAPGTGTTNYYSRYSFDGTTQGFTESGDRNQTNHILNNFSGKTGAKGVWATSLMMRDGNGTYQNVCTASDGTATSSNRTTATTKKANTNGFEIGSPVLYNDSSFNANANITGGVYASIGAFDSRYVINSTLTANFLTVYQPIYLVGTIGNDGLFYLDTVWWTQTPTTQGKVYVLIGNVYDSSTSYCRFSLTEPNPWLVYDGSKLVDYNTYIANTALTAANGKNKNFYLPSNTAPTDPSAGDQWFKTDKGMELYRYDGSAWQKVGLTSAAFSSADIGDGTVGRLGSLLIYNDDDYWNLSGASFDANFLPTSVEADIKYRANTLRTHHLRAENDIYVDGGPDSYLRIPTENDDLSYVEMSNGGMTVVARTQLENSLYELTTLYPSISAIDHASDTTTDLLESPLVDYKVFGEVSNSTMLYTKIADPLDPHEYYEYNVTQGVKEVKFAAEAGAFDQNDEKVKDDADAATYGAYGIRIECDDNGTDEWENIFHVDSAGCVIGTLMRPISFNVNGISLSNLAPGAGHGHYPTASGHYGACAVREESGMCKVMSLGVSASGKTLYVYGSDNIGSLNYIGRVALV